MISEPLPRGEAAVASATADDLTRIKGIGPAIERRLHDHDIRTYAQLAVRSPAQIAAIVGDLAGASAERIARQDWIGQARTFALEVAPSGALRRTSAPADRQHYATFAIELLLDDENNVRRTRIEHIQSAEQEPGTWAGWDQGRLVRFIVEHAAMRLPEAEAALASIPAAPPAPTVLGGTMQLRDLESMRSNAAGPRSVIGYEEPFTIRLTLDLGEATVPAGGTLDYAATIQAKDLSGGPRRVAGEAQGTIVPQETLTLTMEGRPLPRGAYRLEAAVTLRSPPEEQVLTAYLEGSILQIY